MTVPHRQEAVRQLRPLAIRQEGQYTRPVEAIEEALCDQE
jgi:hypothetical protein